MPDSNGSQELQLPTELASALQRTTAKTLGALHSLRVALRDHVHSERSRGASLAEIHGGLREMIILADGDGDGDGADHSPERVSELTTQMLKWCESFYSVRR